MGTVLDGLRGYDLLRKAFSGGSLPRAEAAARVLPLQHAQVVGHIPTHRCARRSSGLDAARSFYDTIIYTVFCIYIRSISIQCILYIDVHTSGRSYPSVGYV